MPSSPHGLFSEAIAAAAVTVAELFVAQVHSHGDDPAMQQETPGTDGAPLRRTYRELNARVNRLAWGLAGLGVVPGSRIAVLSENRVEYLELKLAAAKLGAIVACQNWRQADPELSYCLRLVEPCVIVHSERYLPVLQRLKLETSTKPNQANQTDQTTQPSWPTWLSMGPDYEQLLAAASDAEPAVVAKPEDGLVLLYTSGTTGHPKAALLSHRAIIARSMVNALDRPTTRDDAFLAWTPLFHMGASDHALSTLMRGGKVILMDGFDPTAMVRAIGAEQLGWLHVMPGTADRLLAALDSTAPSPKRIRYIGVMADLMPRNSIAELTRRLDAPYINTFGSTEAGGIASRGQIAIGVQPERLSKQQSSLCSIRLVDTEDCEVAPGQPGEMLVRGPSLFSGYWRAPELNAALFRNGWFHTGDVFVRNPDGSMDFVDRLKYLIKSGGENIYPAELERLLLGSPRIADAVVVRRADQQWGEVPVAFVVRADPQLDAAAVLALCDGQVARYKLPREIRFIEAAALPRSTSGKIMRNLLERLLQGEQSALQSQ
jgi:acyl-CoA synthetase (AMP-forming)/AMP-acid ligase II